MSEITTDLSKPAGGRSGLSESVMSNFDHQIDYKVAEELRKDPRVCAQYAAWNFCGYVWANSTKDSFSCEVWRFHEPVEIVEGTLHEIMDEVSDRWGSE